jgi:hypothetical protein
MAHMPQFRYSTRAGGRRSSGGRWRRKNQSSIKSCRHARPCAGHLVGFVMAGYAFANPPYGLFRFARNNENAVPRATN